MSLKWRVLDLINFDGHVGSCDGGLRVGEHEIRLADVGVILLGQSCTWGFGLAAMASKFDVCVLICDWRSVPIGALVQWRESSRVGSRHLAQASLSEPRRKNAWMQVVKAKVSHQSIALHTMSRPGGRRTAALAAAVRSGDPANIEAQAARIYWSCIFHDSFTRDQNARDFCNGALNYGYTILRGHVIREIAAAGLWGTLGIFHRGRSNNFSLADDLIEPFRPAVDLVVAELFNEQSELSRDVKQRLVAVADMPFQSTGTTVQSSIRQLAQAFAQYVEGEVQVLQVPKWSIAT